MGSIHRANILPTTRCCLFRVLKVLADFRPHTTREIAETADVCAVNSCVAEIRAAGWPVKCTRTSGVWWYQLGIPKTQGVAS